MNNQRLKSLPLSQIYRNLYPWATLNEFVEQCIATIAYKSPDNSLIALNKPFGLGTFIVNDRNTHKTNQDRLLSNLGCSPRYCLADALGPITDEFNSPKPYQILKGTDRYTSGLTLITNDFDRHRVNLSRSLQTAKIETAPPFGYRAITCGYPIVKSNKIFERVGCEMVEVDELGNHKEPIISAEPGSSFKRKRREKSIFQVEMTVQRVNRENATALIEIFASKSRWDFVRAYITSKTSFILGDVRFSKRIREVLGRRIQVSAFRSSHSFQDAYEPLGPELQRILGVGRNSSIPLMLDHHELRLKNFFKGPEYPERDLIIKSQNIPLHFFATARKLNLLDALDLNPSAADLEDDISEHNKSDIVA